MASSAICMSATNTELTGPLFHPIAFLEFFGSQFGVFGPLCFAALLAIVARPRSLAEPRARLLAAFALPTLAMMLGISFLSRAQPNWAAPAYVFGHRARRGLGAAARLAPRLRAAIALNLAGAIALFGAGDALAALGIAVPAQYDPLHRLRGWRSLGQQVGTLMAAHPGLTLLADDREPFGGADLLCPAISVGRRRMEPGPRHHRSVGDSATISAITGARISSR